MALVGGSRTEQSSATFGSEPQDHIAGPPGDTYHRQ